MKKLLFLCLALVPLCSITALEKTVAPTALVEQLYAAHDAHKGPFFQGDRSLLETYFTKDFAGLIWKATRNAKGEVGALDFDPLYYAQDTEVKNFTIHPAVSNMAQATVNVTFTNFGEEVKLIFALKRDSGKPWKIDDIRYSDGGDTLRDILGGAG